MLCNYGPGVLFCLARRRLVGEHTGCSPPTRDLAHEQLCGVVRYIKRPDRNPGITGVEHVELNKRLWKQLIHHMENAQDTSLNLKTDRLGDDPKLRELSTL